MSCSWVPVDSHAATRSNKGRIISDELSKIMLCLQQTRMSTHTHRKTNKKQTVLSNMVHVYTCRPQKHLVVKIRVRRNTGTWNEDTLDHTHREADATACPVSCSLSEPRYQRTLGRIWKKTFKQNPISMLCH